MHRMLTGQGWIALEIGDGQGQAVSQFCSATQTFTNIKIVKDYAQRERVVLAQKV